MKSSNGLIKFIDIKKLIFDFIWISCLGVITVIFLMDVDYLYTKEYLSIPIIYIMRGIAVVSGIKYSTKIMKISTSRTTADFAYSLPISKTKYYFSKFAAVTIMELLTLIVVGVIGGIFTIELLPLSWLYPGDIVFIVIENLILAILVSCTMFLSLSATGKIDLVFRLFGGILLFPIVFTMLCEFETMYETHIGHIGFLTTPNLYIPTNVLFLRSRTNILYYGIGKSMLFTFLLALVYLGIGLYLFQKRDIQTIDAHTTNKWVNYISMSVLPFFIIYFTWQYVFKRTIFKSHYYLNYISEYFDLNIVILLFAFALFLMFLYDMRIFGKFRLKSKCIPVFIILMIFSSSTIYAIHKYTYRSENITINGDNIDHINLVLTGFSRYNYVYGDNLSYGSQMAEKIDIVNKDIFEDISDLYKEGNVNSITGSNFFPLIKVTMKNGSKKYISLSKDEMLDMQTPLDYYGNEITNAYYQCPPPEIVKTIIIDPLITLNDSKANDVYSTYYLEFNSLSTECQINQFTVTDYGKGTLTNLLAKYNISIIGRIGSQTTYNNVFLDKNTPKTVYKIHDLYNNTFKDDVIDRLTSTNIPDTIIFELYDDGYRIYGSAITSYDRYNEFYRNKFTKIFNKNDWSTPKVTDKILKINYWDNTGSQNGGCVYIKLTDDDYEVLCNNDFLYDN